MMLTKVISIVIVVAILNLFVMLLLCFVVDVDSVFVDGFDVTAVVISDLLLLTK